MAEPTIRTEYVGGPCDGRVRNDPVSVLATGAITCMSKTYIVQGVTPTLYRATYEPDTRNLGPGGPIAGTPQFGQAWTTLMHTLAQRIPAQLKRQEVALQRIRKAVR